MRGSWLEWVEEYITWRKNTVAKYITTQTILNIYEEAERGAVTRFTK